uniref:Uncharacterized protein n=1 Tax=Nelumbo nucifera TaxID=4432 RepID=A0A822ZU38_NELNU|nr:TPA_asm: hypothetical protein HUJ06_016736 [Nelumbo nucifera]
MALEWVVHAWVCRGRRSKYLGVTDVARSRMTLEGSHHGDLEPTKVVPSGGSILLVSVSGHLLEVSSNVEIERCRVSFEARVLDSAEIIYGRIHFELGVLDSTEKDSTGESILN